jgi:hypothetical protein
MQYEAQQVKAEGVVGVEPRQNSHGWGSHVIEFFAIGTAIVPLDTGGGDHIIKPPTTVLALNSR